MEPLLLGLDLGTTSCKAAVVTLDGRELAHGRAPVPWRRVPTGAETVSYTHLTLPTTPYV